VDPRITACASIEADGAMPAVIVTADTRIWSVDLKHVVAWESAAMTTAASLRAGMAVTVDGRLQTCSWEAADGLRCRARWMFAAVLNCVIGARL
jgi:Single-strand binding protein family